MQPSTYSLKDVDGLNTDHTAFISYKLVWNRYTGNPPSSVIRVFLYFNWINSV
jgi:hypothetical protein